MTGDITSYPPSASAPTILGRNRPRIPVGGRIRAGIKVLTRKAEQFERACQIYEQGIDQGRSFEEIERALARCLPDLRNPLAPRNVPYFTVRPGDFGNPQVARTIMDLYGEDRGEGPKLYRFPVVFPADEWQAVMPHELVAWTANERQFWSEYSADGQTRYCKTYEPVPMDRNSKRAIRIFGGRKSVIRQSNDGLCDPENCPQYQSRACNLTGRFIFFIPGVRSLSAIDLPTNSFYAMQAAIEKFQTIGFMRGGRISGFLDANGSTFFLSKRLVEISRIDETGKPVRTKQWLVELEAEVDATALLRHDDEGVVDARAANAVQMFNDGPARANAVDVAPVEADAADYGSGQPADAPLPAAPAKTTDEAVGRDGNAGSSEPATMQSASQAAAHAGEPAEPTGLNWIFEAAEAMGVDRKRFDAYARKKWGPGWQAAASGRKQALAEIERFEDDAARFVATVNAEIEMSA
ncbi:MAG TPA: hypothetical protein PK177_18880 [Burkholderiaceae bacterium]|mgnify:CR=1 FL=1|nr:hypothetical protein [Burkholderiaceae bacterium]